MTTEKIIVAYSGGLDTSVIPAWLKENYDAKVISVFVDVGQNADFKEIEERAYAAGTDKFIVLDLKDEFVTQYIWPLVKAGAVYEDDYVLGSAMTRPMIASKLIDVAKEEEAKYIAHGGTGKQNDQVRFESTIHALDPYIKIIAPWRKWDMHSRDDLIAYAKEHKIPVEPVSDIQYSRDLNLWSVSHEGAHLENPWHAHREDVHLMSKAREQAPDLPGYVELEFVKGVPVALDGDELPPVDLIMRLNELGGEHGVGVVDIVENRLVGMKSRAVYESPGGTIILNAHKTLEKLVLDRETLFEKGQIARRYAQLIYDGRWFTPLREAIDAFVDVTQEVVTGTVSMKLFKGNAIAIASKSPESLYNVEYATFGEDRVFNQRDAEGYTNITSIPMKIRAFLKHQTSRSTDSIKY